ncbi:MAG: PilN domain-containing protein [Wenzhouxiangellaceae bacterium]|nr:PilN domain-containing protein [Wenzhouxiangellaceae bacterium]
MMQQIADKFREPIRQRYRATPLPAFFAWWGRELGELMPPGLRRCLMPAKPQLWIVPAASGGGDLRIWRADDTPQLMDVFGAGEDLELLRERWRTIVAGFEDGQPEIRLCLHEDQYLELPVELPAAVESNLSEALRFQLDQLSPFRADQVMLDHRVAEHDPAHGRIRVDLRIVPNETVDTCLDRLRSIGMTVHVVDSLADDQPPRPEGFNLLPEPRRPHYVHARARFNALLGLGLIVALGLVMMQSLILRERTLSELQASADSLRAEALQVTQLQQELQDSLLAANYLSQRRASQPATIELLDEVTRLLPEDIWLQRFQLQGKDLTIQGLADGSQRIVGLLNESEMLASPEIRGTINIDPVTGKERFTTMASVVGGDQIGMDPDASGTDQ